jgi:exodeoxyribonuclease VII large subunit
MVPLSWGPLEEGVLPDHKIYKVSEITRQLRLMLEEAFPEVWVEGEVSNYKEHTSGHVYFSLKDDSSELRCVMFRTDVGASGFRASDGVKVKALGRITIYERRGYYQLQVFYMRPSGVGELSLAFERLKEKLRDEGLFSEDRKKALPDVPSKIGLVTAKTGAAIKDILNILGRRWPLLTVVLRSARVQGEGSAAEVAEAIDDLNEYGEVDLIIVGRGGGSLEDLWAFNEEIVARAIDRSRIPVVSAVGHEIDYTISDFVADKRAPTPSAAALIVVPDMEESLSRLENLFERTMRAASERIAALRSTVDGVMRSYGLRRPRDMILERWQNLDELERRSLLAVRHHVELARRSLSAFESRVRSQSPEATLSRGYCICRRLPHGSLVRGSSDLEKEDSVSLQFGKGKARCLVEDLEA